MTTRPAWNEGDLFRNDIKSLSSPLASEQRARIIHVVRSGTAPWNFTVTRPE